MSTAAMPAWSLSAAAEAEREVDAALEADIEDAHMLRVRRDMDALDLRRKLARIDGRIPQVKLARRLNMSGPGLSKLLSRAKETPPVAEGFSGAGPLEIAKRYAAGLLSRDEVIDELSRWEYAPRPQTDGIDWLTVDVPGSVEELEEAEADGYIDMSIYEAVDARLTSRGV